jgi:hypothetical protein
MSLGAVVHPAVPVLLQAGQHEVYLHGFHGASLGAILARAAVTKLDSVGNLDRLG